MKELTKTETDKVKCWQQMVLSNRGIIAFKNFFKIVSQALGNLHDI